jgi:flavorubredoxin
MMPMMAAVLNYLEGLRPSGKAGFAFGSYGWGKGAPEAIDEYLNKIKWEITRPPLRAQYRPTPEILDECRLAGETLAQKAREMAPQPTTGDPVCIEP